MLSVLHDSASIECSGGASGLQSFQIWSSDFSGSYLLSDVVLSAHDFELQKLEFLSWLPSFASSNFPTKTTLTFSVLLFSWGVLASSGFLVLLDGELDDEEVWLDCESACSLSMEPTFGCALRHMQSTWPVL